MTKQKDLIKNTLIIAFGKLSTQFLTLLLLPLYTAYLSTGEFGTVDLVLTYVTLLAPVLMLQLEMASFRHLIDARGDEARKKAVISNALQIVVKCVTIFAVLFITFNFIAYIPYGWFAFGAVLAAIASSLFLQIARGFGDNLKFSIGGVVTGVTTIIANIVLIVVLGMKAEGMLLAMLLGNIAGATYLFFALRLNKYISFTNVDKSLQKQLLSYSLPLIPNGVAWWAINAADRTIITIFLGVASNGIYAVAYRFPLIFNGLFSFFGMSWTESASMHINSPDRDKFFSQTMNASIQLFGSLGLCIIAGVSLIFSLIIDASYREAYLYIPLLIVGSFFNSIVGLYSAVYIAKKMTRQVMNTSLIAAGVSIVLSLATIKYLGLFAPAVAVSAAHITMAVYRHHDIKKYVTIRYDVWPLVLLGGAYATVVVIYYANMPLLNLANIVFAAAFAVYLNKSFVKIIKTKILSRRQKLTPDQQVAEEIKESSQGL